MKLRDWAGSVSGDVMWGVNPPLNLKCGHSGCVLVKPGLPQHGDCPLERAERILDLLSRLRLGELETWLCTPPPVSWRGWRSSAGGARTERGPVQLDPAGSEIEETKGPARSPASLPTELQPEAASKNHVVRKRRRLPSTPGGLLFNTGIRPGENDKIQTTQASTPHHFGDNESTPWRSLDRTTLRKSISADDSLSQLVRKEQRTLLSRIGKGRSKARRKHSLGPTAGTDFQQKNLNMTQEMQNLHLSNSTKNCSPASPNAAKRLYRNLSNKFKGSHSSFGEVCQITRAEREQLRVSSLNLQCNEALFEAVEHQDLQAVRLLLTQYSLDELDLNTPNSEGLVPLDIALMTNNVPMARSLLKAGAVESPHFVSVESRASHLTSLIEEARERVSELTSQVMREADGPSTEQQKQLTAWEWRYRLYKRMKMGFELARVPEAPTNVRLSVTSSTSLMVTFQEALSVNSAVVTRYKVEWSSLMDFSAQRGEMIIEDPDSVRCTIPGLTTGQVYSVRVSAANMKGWGPPRAASPEFAVPSNWREWDGRPARVRGQVQLLEHLLQQERAQHHRHCMTENSKLQNPSRKQLMSQSLKHLFHSSTKFVKTLKRGVYIAAIFYHEDNILVTSEDQIPIVEVDHAQSGSMTQEFLWFTKLSCAWEEVDWLRQSLSVSTSSSTALQARHRMVMAAAQLQTLLGSQNLGRVYYEPIKDRHGNVLLVTVRELSAQTSFTSCRWILFSKFQSQRKSLSTPEQPTALDILLVTLQDVLSYQKRSEQRLNPGLYLGYLKVSSSVDQIKVLVPFKLPNVLCHVKVRDNSNVSREEWQWVQRMSRCREPSDPDSANQQTPLLRSELRAALGALLREINLPLHQAGDFRVFTQEVLELGHNVSFLLLLPPCSSVCTAPGQTSTFPAHSSFLKLPLQMFELVHFSTYQENFMRLYCRVSALLEISSLGSQQALREAISDDELLSAKQRDLEVSQSLQQLDGLWREVRWIMDALTYARYKQPSGSLPITWLINSSEEAPRENDSLSSHTDQLPSSPLSDDLQLRSVSGWWSCSDDESISEVFLPPFSVCGSSAARSPREPDLLPASAHPLGQRLAQGLSDSAPDILRPRGGREPAAGDVATGDGAGSGQLSACGRRARFKQHGFLPPSGVLALAPRPGEPSGPRALTSEHRLSPGNAESLLPRSPAHGLQAGPEPGSTGPESERTGPEPGSTGPESERTGPEPGSTGPESERTGPEPGSTGPEPGSTGPEPGSTGPEPGSTGPEPGSTGPEPDWPCPSLGPDTLSSVL